MEFVPSKFILKASIAFSMLIITSLSSFSQDYGKSYVNVTKGTSGGTVEPGDVLEIRATFVVRSGSFTNCSFSDVLPANTTYVPNTLRILTNEGQIFRQWTDASGDDAASISGSNITINLGTGATSSSGGTIKNTDKPSFYGSTCIMVASYRITVNSSLPYYTKIGLGGGSLTYTSGSVVNIHFPNDSIMVYKNYGMCSNAVGGNALLTEFGGTFGSGIVKDRGASSNVPSNYTYATFSSTGGMPGDYYYGVTNNTSGGNNAATGYSISNAWAYPDNSQNPSHRIFGLWDIIGDHTNSSNPLLGNPATDDNSNASGGYMLVINSSYRTDTAFLDTVTNLCPNTYYQYTAWIRNMCSKCGCDSNGKGASSSGYVPTGIGDSSGVHPNLTFNVNGSDYYTTGNVLYTGQWIKKGFIYKTGPTETSMIINVRNNAPGGGGNDWALDDIAVSSCLPNIALLPNKPDTLCQGSDDTVRYQVTSFFNNYTEWKLETSVDNGVTWTSPGNDTTGAAASGSATPVYDSTLGQYQYVITRYYRLDNTHTLVKYRITVASTTANLNDGDCSIVSSTPMEVYAVNCTSILPVDFIYFNGQLKSGNANLKWVTANETATTQYKVERSSDQVNYEIIGTLNSQGSQGENDTYNFIDTKPINGATYYRILMVDGKEQKLSQVVLVNSEGVNFDVKLLVNPFNNQLSFELLAPDNNEATFTIFDMYGRIIKQQKQNVFSGINNVTIQNLGSLPVGIYSLRIQYENNMIIKQVLKAYSK